MEHYSLKQLSLYPLTTQFTLKAINFTSGEIKVFKDTVVYFEYATKYLKYLQHLNTQGFNVFFLPALVLGGCVDFFLDDISKNGIQILYSDGLKPLYYLETSPGNFQVILRFTTPILDNAEYLGINRYFVEKYVCNKNSVGRDHFFRLAGFTNRKEKYRNKDTGYFPFVRLTVGGAVLDKSLLPPVAIAPVARPQRQGRREGGGGNCDHYVRVIYLSGGESDISKLDFKVARVASKKGFTENEIAGAIRRYSPNLEARKAGHVEDYILRTIRKAALSLNNSSVM